MAVKLIVIRSEHLPQMAGFYTLLGFTPEYHSHGGSPMHYSFTTNGTVVEIYPLAKGQTTIDKYLRLGFEIGNFDETVAVLKAKGFKFHGQPLQTGFGYMAVVEDPERRKVELYRKT